MTIDELRETVLELITQRPRSMRDVAKEMGICYQSLWGFLQRRITPRFKNELVMRNWIKKQGN
jgi:molybdenum-dependent DNA-binding transcriptional regulator ModE